MGVTPSCAVVEQSGHGLMEVCKFEDKRLLFFSFFNNTADFEGEKDDYYVLWPSILRPC